MADVGDISLAIGPEGQPVIGLGAEQFDDLDKLVDLIPALGTEAQIERYCEVVNHLASGYEYRVILDPEAFKSAYADKQSAENPDRPWQEGVARLSDFGNFDLSQITAPSVATGGVEFYVEDTFYGLPYHVVAAQGSEPQYEPLPQI